MIGTACEHAPGTLLGNTAAPYKGNAPADVEFTLIAQSRHLTDVCNVRKSYWIDCGQKTRGTHHDPKNESTSTDHQSNLQGFGLLAA
jgi:hypothetical protein